MKAILNEELVRAFRNHRFGIVFALTLISLIVGWHRTDLTAMPDNIHPVNLLLLVLSYGDYSLLAALLATLPFADSFLDDRNQGFLRFIALRVAYRKYLTAKSLAVSLAGAVSVCAPLLLMFILLSLFGPADFSARGYVSFTTLNPAEPWGPLGWLYTLNPLFYLAFLLLSALLFGAVYGLMGLALSALVNNRYVVLLAPLVFFQVFSYLEERSLRILPAWNPVYTIYPYEAQEGFGLIHLFMQYGMILLGGVLCLIVFAPKRRMVI